MDNNKQGEGVRPEQIIGLKDQGNSQFQKGDFNRAVAYYK